MYVREEGHQPLGATARRARLERVHVLIINSSDKAAKLLRNMFKQLGFSHVAIATTAAEAIFVMRQMHIDIVLVDEELKCNGTNTENEEWETIQGTDFVRRMRHAPSSPNRYAAVMMLVEGLTAAQVIAARDAGVNEVITKPLRAEDFCARVVATFDKPRPFITSDTYKGPCRRRKNTLTEGMPERRVKNIQLVRADSPAALHALGKIGG